MVDQEQKTFTGKSLEEMTLEQKLLEVQEDWLRLQGLKNGFLWGVKNVGVGYALKRSFQKFKLKGKGQLDEVITDYEGQIEEDKASIESDTDAWLHTSYRDKQHIERVKNIFERLQDAGDNNTYSDARRFIKDHLDAIKSEKRRLNLDEKFPEETLYKKCGRIKNYFVDNLKFLVPVAFAFTIGGGSFLGAKSYYDHQNRHRPTHTVVQAIDDNHPGVEAATSVNDAAMTGNRLVNLYLNGNHTGIIESHNKTLPLVQRATKNMEKATRYYNKIRPAIANTVRGGNMIRGAWDHDSSKHTHIETHCTGSGKDRSCTSIVVCDYVDNWWRFNPRVAASGIAAYRQGLVQMEGNMPEPVDITRLESTIRNYIKENERYRSLNQEEQTERYERMTDFLHSVTIEGNNELIGRLLGIKGAALGGDFSWLERNMNDRNLFPLRKFDRDYTCFIDDSPVGYDRSLAFAIVTNDLGYYYGGMRDRINNSIGHLNNYEQALKEINRSLETGVSAINIEDLYEDLGEETIALQKELNPESDYSMLSKGWRIAIPFMLLFGLGGLGATGGYLLVKTMNERRYRNRMYSSGLK